MDHALRKKMRLSSGEKRDAQSQINIDRTAGGRTRAGKKYSICNPPYSGAKMYVSPQFCMSTGSKSLRLDHPWARSVFIVTRPLQLPEFQLLSPVPTFRYWGLLVSPLDEDELRGAIRSYATLGAFWEFPAHQDPLKIKLNVSFSINGCEDPISMEYCAKTIMYDEAITQEVENISNYYSDYELLMNNCENFILYFVKAICPDCIPLVSPQFICRWLSLPKTPQLVRSDSSSLHDLADVADLTKRAISNFGPIGCNPTPQSSSSCKEEITTNTTLTPERDTPKIKDEKPRRHYNYYGNDGKDIQDNPEPRAVPRTDSAAMWDFQEPQPDRNNGAQRLDIWILPFAQDDGRKHHSTGGIVTIVFRYYHDAFIELAWPRAMKQFSDLLGLDSYSHNYLSDCYQKALTTWEDNVDKQPSNLVMISRLAQEYVIFGDVNIEIAGWWRLCERHPMQILFWKFLRQACIRKYSLKPGFSSLCSFILLCILHLVSCRAGKMGLCYLDWWPLAGDDELMIFQPNMEKQLWKIDRTGITGHDWVERISTQSRQIKSSTSTSVIADHSETGMSDDGGIHRREQLPTEGSLTSQSSRVSSILHPQSPETQAPFPGSAGHTRRGLGVDPALANAVGVKYVPLSLCLYEQLLEPDIVIENAQHWEDREVMQKIQQAYWEARGAWKKWPTQWRIWPWKVLHKIGYAKMRVFTDPMDDRITRCDKLRPCPLEDSSENTGPTDSQWRTFFNHPENCQSKQTWLRNHLPKYDAPVVGGYRGLDILVLYFEHRLAVGMLVTIVVLCATCVAVCWAVMNSDISGGLGIGAYIIGVISLIVVIYIHNQNVGHYSQR